LFDLGPVATDDRILRQARWTWKFNTRDFSSTTNPTGYGGMVAGPTAPPLGVGMCEYRDGRWPRAVEGQRSRSAQCTDFAGTLIRLDQPR